VYPAEVGTLLSRAWAVLQPGLVPAALGSLALFGIHMVVNLPANLVVTFGTAAVTEALGDGALAIGFAVIAQIGLLAVSQATSALMLMGMAQGSHKLVTTGNAEVTDFLPLDPVRIGKGMLTQLLMSLVIFIGMLLFFVPGIIAAIGLMLWPYAVAVEGHGPVDALKRSWQLMDGAKIHLLLFGVAVGIGGIFVMLFTCGVGSLLLMPFLHVGYALIFVGAVENKPALADAH
jgi:uncharacterized membrane protein